MRIMPDVRPVEIHNRHSVSRSGAGESSERNTRMFIGQENIKTIFSKPPLITSSRHTSRKYNSREATPRNDKVMKNDLGEVENKSVSADNVLKIEDSDNLSDENNQATSPHDHM